MCPLLQPKSFNILLISLLISLHDVFNMLDINMDLTDAVAEDIATGNIDSSSDSGISSGGEDDAHITEIG